PSDRCRAVPRCVGVRKRDRDPPPPPARPACRQVTSSARVSVRPRHSLTAFLQAVWPLLVPAALLVVVIALTSLAAGDIQNTANLMLIDLLVVLGLYTFSGQSGVLSF